MRNYIFHATAVALLVTATVFCAQIQPLQLKAVGSRLLSTAHAQTLLDLGLCNIVAQGIFWPVAVE